MAVMIGSWSEMMLQVEDLTCLLGKRKVLGGIALDLPKGELHCLVGPNGAGKTTLLRAVAGLITVQSGKITICGANKEKLSRRDMARLVTLVPQGGIEPLPFTVMQFVLLGRYAYLGTLGRYTPEDHEKAGLALKAVQAEEIADRPLGELSGGERQKAVLARSLAQSSPLMLLDEPTAFLDLDGQLEVLSLVKQIVAEGDKSALAVTHDLNLAAVFADRVHLIKDGSIRFFGSPQEVLVPSVLGQIYRSPLKVIPDGGDGRPRVFVNPQNQ